MNSRATKLAAIAAITLTANAALATDSYLYWMVDQDSDSGDAIAFNYATIKDKNATTYLNWYVGNEELGPQIYVSDYTSAETLGYDTGRVYSYLGSGEAIETFLVELWNGSDERLGYAEFDRATVAAAIFGGTNEAGASAHAVSAFTVVPEPTSGLLMLFGLAGLALRRKRRA